MIPTKICGITNMKDALVAVENGASAVGFIFYTKSPRAIDIKTAKSISNDLPKNVSRVGVFVNHDKIFINKCIQSVPLNMIQLHGDETPEICNQFRVPVIKALRINNQESLSQMDRFNVAGYLLDTFSDQQYGGTGKTFDWSLLNNIKEKSIVLSGGLNPNNILDAIISAHPSAIDVNSGVESSPGIKDHDKIKLLFRNLNNTQQTGFYFG